MRRVMEQAPRLPMSGFSLSLAGVLLLLRFFDQLDTLLDLSRT